ncbi:plastocyanin/azurin family copper-binding protein [Haladaptatus cibarius]|uniref:plastocyanin/azurin family copper-binding protein n=1 Tax=Haladaptatus cibarius TaxID=453847 RepID=UPI000679D0AB
MGGTETTRRGFLRGLSGGTAVASTAGVASAQNQQTVEMTDSLVYEPESITVSPGTTVVWDNVGSVGHSVTAYEDEIPEEAGYFASGGFDSEQAARDAYPEGDIGGGEQYEHTFDVEGTYEYFCIPHESAGMVGTVEVGAGGGGEGGGGGGGALPSVPNSAITLGVATMSAMVTVLVLSYFFLKYGGDYGLD